MSETQEFDRKDLKIQALLEKISILENQVADLRVDLTVSEYEKSQLQASLAEKAEENVPSEKKTAK